MNEPQSRRSSAALGLCALLFVLPFLLAAWLWGVTWLAEAAQGLRQVLGV